MSTLLNALSLPAGATFTTRNSMTYSVNAALQTVASNAADARELCASGNFEPAVKSGSTSQRPTDTWPGRGYFDTTLQQFITRNAIDAAWLGASGNAV
jgi:hypothetical protein